MPIQTPAQAMSYAKDQHLAARAADAREGWRAEDEARAARNKRDWALRQWSDLTREPDPTKGDDDAIHAFLFPASAGAAA